MGEVEPHSRPAPGSGKAGVFVGAKGGDALFYHFNDVLSAGLESGAVSFVQLELVLSVEEVSEWWHDGMVRVEAADLVDQSVPAAHSCDGLGLREFCVDFEHLWDWLHGVLGQREPKVLHFFSDEAEILLVKVVPFRAQWVWSSLVWIL